MHIRIATLTLMLAAICGAAMAQEPALPAGGTQTPGPPSAQNPAAAPQAQAPPATSQPAAPATATDLLQPALSSARETLMSLKLEKWKKGSVRDEAESNVNALLHDLDNNMRPLEAAADAAPGQLSKAIPLVKHLDAFYDVMLRVEEASRVSAPTDQISAVQESLLRVSRARNAYDDVLETQAAGQEKQMGDLQTAVKAERDNVKEAQRQAELAKASAAAPPCKPATPARRKRRTTPATKTTPAQTTKPAASTQPAPSAQPVQKPQ